MPERFTGNFFGPRSPYLHHPLLTAARTAGEVDRLESLLGPPAATGIVDIGCGFGRHSLELGRRGYIVTGIDPSATMIAAARASQALAGGPATVRFAVAAGDDLGPEDRFDGAICMFTTLGQIELDDEDNRGLLDRVASALRSGAKLVVEVPQRDGAVAALASSEQFGDESDGTVITRNYDPVSRCVTEAFAVTEAGATRHFDLRYRLFSAEELRALLAGAGFVDVELAADLDALARESTPGLDPGSPTMVAVATAGHRATIGLVDSPSP